jgi:hypothetical protein
MAENIEAIGITKVFPKTVFPKTLFPRPVPSVNPLSASKLHRRPDGSMRQSERTHRRLRIASWRHEAQMAALSSRGVGMYRSGPEHQQGRSKA